MANQKGIFIGNNSQFTTNNNFICTDHGIYKSNVNFGAACVYLIIQTVVCFADFVIRLE